MNYRIKRLTIASTEFVDITDVDMHRIQAAASSLRVALFLEEKFDWVVEGYLNFENHLLQATLRNLTCDRVDDGWLVEDRHEANRQMLSLSAACRSYVDRAGSYVRLICADDAARSERVVDALRHEYDNSFSYRLMEALRNFVQHEGFAAYSVSLSFRRSAESAKNLAGYHMDISLGYEDLLDAGGFKAQVLDELKTLGRRVKLRGAVTEYISCLARVHKIARENVRDRVAEADQVFSEAIARFQSAFPSDPSMAGVAAIAYEDQAILKKVFLSSKFTSDRKWYESKNSQVDRIDRCYVSSVDPRTLGTT